MFVTILTFIYSGIAIYVLYRYAKKKASRIAAWREKANLKLNTMMPSNKNWSKNSEKREPVSELHTEVN
ncbi:hypothetical protein LVD15_01365 [Fulvivirga maritima]|uniref:hypothetical protein n=1 Tax=Fulvivirga maritima TaxID=2904247 RepID=UPI001F1963FD|nr:hypothetical protein [Fulvivirga maritima]UII27102.1 hypothetical protein LVD15_01365 [Fulvivirga maritima]